MKKASENKVKSPQANKGPVGKVLVEILPGRGIGGVGGPGTRTWMGQAEADEYARTGYVRILQEEPVQDMQVDPGQPEEKE